MRNVFSEWYWLEEEDLQHFVRSATIALDANVLLDLYRHSKATRESVLEAFFTDDVRHRLFLPYQAGLEYHRNRLSVAYEHDEKYREIISQLDPSQSSKNQQFGSLVRTLRKVRDEDVRGRLIHVTEASISKACKKIRKAVKEARALNVLDPDKLQTSDPIRDRLEELLAEAGQIGEHPSSKVRESRIKKARKRLETNRPPGLEDAGKADGGIGDSLIWMELLDRAKTGDCDVLFVSNDVKKDWILEEHGRTLGPLPELRREFQETTGRQFHQVTLRSFLSYLNTYLDTAIDDETLAEVGAAPTIDVDGNPSGTAWRQWDVLAQLLSSTAGTDWSADRDLIDQEVRNLREDSAGSGEEPAQSQ